MHHSKPFLPQLQQPQQAGGKSTAATRHNRTEHCIISYWASSDRELFVYLDKLYATAAAARLPMRASKEQVFPKHDTSDRQSGQLPSGAIFH